MSNTKEKIIIITKNRYLPWVLIVAILVGGFFLYSHFNGIFENDLIEQQEKYKRQLSGALTKHEREKQEFNKSLGIAKAQLLTEEELNKKYKKEKEFIDKEYEVFKKKYNYKISSYEKAIAVLNSKIKEGTVTVIVENNVCETEDGKKPVISYRYQDVYERFVLTDVNIFEEGDETLEIKQKFKIYSELLIEKNGSLKTKKIILSEVIEKEDGSYFEIGRADILDYQFVYHTPKPKAEESWISKHLDLFSMIGTVGYGYNSGLKAGIGCEWIRIKKAVGLATTVDLEFDDWKGSGISAGITYRIPKTNLGFEVLVGTPFVEFGKNYYINGALIFYIW